jgi:hypothetical protein
VSEPIQEADGLGSGGHTKEGESKIEPFEVVDSLVEVVDLIEAARMAALDLSTEHQGPMRVLLGVAADRLRAVRDQLEPPLEEFGRTR